MEKKSLLFGAAYYLEYLPYDRIKEDIQMMKDAGMNVVRIAESTWSTLEPEQGIFCFNYVDAVLDALEEEGMMCIIGTPTYAVPSWLVKKDPDVMVTTKNGQAIYGSRQIMDIMNPTYREHAEKVIRTLISHTAHKKCVIGFQIDNETKHYGTSSEYVQELFKTYLQEKFGTTSVLNAVYNLQYWSNSIIKWDELPDMRGCINAGLASEFERFQRKLAADYLSWQAGIVREYARKDQFVTHNLDFEWKKIGAEIAQDGYSYGIQRDIEHSQVSQIVDVVGTDIYHPTQDELTGAEIAFCGDEIRSLKKKNYFVLECQAQAFKYWTPYPGQLRIQAYSHLASGAESVIYWNWHSIHNGYETYWKGLLSHDLSTNPTYEEAAKIGKEFMKLGGEKLVITKKNKIAIVVDNHTLTSYQWFPIDKELTYNDVVRWMYDSLYEINLECDIVHAEMIDKGKCHADNYSILITPALYSVSETLVQKLDNFVKNGGILISSFKSFVADRNLSVYHDAQPHSMTDCFGMSYNQFTIPGKAKLAYENSTYEIAYFAELLKIKSASTIAGYEHKYWDKYAAISCNSYGKGTAYYIGTFTDKKILQEIYRAAAIKAGIINIQEEYINWPIIIKKGQNQQGKLLYYMLHYSEEIKKIVCPYEAVCDLLTGKMYHKNEEIVLKDWEVLVLEETITF